MRVSEMMMDYILFILTLYQRLVVIEYLLSVIMSQHFSQDPSRLIKALKVQDNNDQCNTGLEMINYFFEEIKKLFLCLHKLLSRPSGLYTLCAVELNLTNYLISYVKTD